MTHTVGEDGSTVEYCIKRASSINSSATPVNGCFTGSVRNTKQSYSNDLLATRVPWAVRSYPDNKSSRTCNANDIPFCTALSIDEAERLGAQYIALQKCDAEKNAAHIVDAVSTCAVLVIGAGGLGSPLLLYLAAGGIGIIGVMDGDVVEVSNLHRQIIHDEESRGMNKALSATNRMLKINSKGKYIAYQRFFGVSEADEILPLYDIIVDATDNPQSRYLINDACVKYNKTLVIASSIGTQGQLMVFNRSKNVEVTPCYKCICPIENPLITSVRGACSFAGVLGTIPGIFGCLQANEVIKLAAGIDNAVLSPGYMLLYDTINVTRPFRCIQVKKSSSCKACGDNAVIKLELLPSQCSVMNTIEDDVAISNQSFLNIYMASVTNCGPRLVKVCFGNKGPILNQNGEEYVISLVDVRPKEHYSMCHLTGAKSWPINDMMDDLFFDDAQRYIGKTKDFENILYKKCFGNEKKQRALIFFICFLGNSSRTATELVRRSLEGVEVFAQ
eukprot:XP_001610316.1 molybdenum cofactor synthesis protein 3 / molybdopterin synthase sulphurylase [Babesia bovis T2Bo]